MGSHRWILQHHSRGLLRVVAHLISSVSDNQLAGFESRFEGTMMRNYDW
jgi:hypothetical protein